MKAKILIIEDVMEIRESIAELWELAEYQTVSAHAKQISDPITVKML